MTTSGLQECVRYGSTPHSHRGRKKRAKRAVSGVGDRRVGSVLGSTVVSQQPL
jgi:hypothetical protein